MNDAPIQIFVNEYSWGFGASYFRDQSEAREAAVRRISGYDEDYIKTHVYELVQS